MQLPHNKHLTVRSFQWETTGPEKSAPGSGSHFLSIRYSPESGQYQRLESVFLPEILDFTWALDQARKHVKITIKPAWMPRYLSDQDPIYEGKNDRAICKCVELVAVSKEYSIEFHEGSEDSSTPRHVKTPQYIERVTYSFNHFLSTLTGLELLVAFSITTSPPGSWKKRPADVLCFRNRDDGVSRVAFRWKDSSGATTGWTTATLTKIVSTHNDKALLEVELAFRQDGQLLGLAGVAAIGGKRNSSTNKVEKWALQLESGSAIPLKYNHCKYTFAQSFMPVISTPLTTFSR